MTHQAHAEKSRTETRLSPEEEPEFQIAPMVDILLVLLIFFMSISSTEVLQRHEGLRLPVAADVHGGNGSSRGQKIINILWTEINRGGVIVMDEITYPRAEELVPILKAVMDGNSQVRVLIRADKNVRYEMLKEAMMAAGQAGVRDVTFSVVNRE